VKLSKQRRRALLIVSRSCWHRKLRSTKSNTKISQSRCSLTLSGVLATSTETPLLTGNMLQNTKRKMRVFGRRLQKLELVKKRSGPKDLLNSSRASPRDLSSLGASCGMRGSICCRLPIGIWILREYWDYYTKREC